MKLALCFLMGQIFNSAIAAGPATLRPDASAPIVISVLSADDKADFESKVLPILSEQTKSCSHCQVKNISPYLETGKVNFAEIPAKLEEARATSSFYFINWNAKATPETKAISDALKKITESGVIVVATAGLAKDGEPTIPLSRTIVGQVKGVVVIGELAERERLLTQSFFGPEMLTALKPPKGFVGLGLGPVFFVSKLASQWNRRPASEWLEQFQIVKMKVRRIWPTTDDLFK